MQSQAPLEAVAHWLDDVVIGLNLCPFASAPRRRDQIHFCLLEQGGEETVLNTLAEEMERLDRDETIETTLVVVPHLFREFDQYNLFLNWVDAMIARGGWKGVYQVASFHPDYCFQGADPDDVENWTNRSPYPIFHLIREDRLEQMLDRYPDADQIPEANMACLRRLSEAQRRALFPHCFP